MSKTANEQITTIIAQFRALSAARQSSLRRQARESIAAKPHTADSSTFWRGLSARQVAALI